MSQSNKKLLTYLLLVQSIIVLIYTWKTISLNGWNFISPYAMNMGSFSWSGQFNIDFGMYLFLSGVWIMWRHKFTLLGIFLGASAIILGFPFFGSYLLFYLVYRGYTIQELLTSHT